MSSVTFTGLSSGLDTAALVTQLVAAERAPADALAARQQDLNTQKSIVGSLSSAVSALGSAFTALALPTQLRPRTATGSDAHVAITATAGALATAHAVRVKQLARGQITSSRTFATAGAGAAGTGTLAITAAGATKTISYTAADSLADVAARINTAGAGVSASVLFDGTSHRLIVAATATGTAAAPTFAETGAGLGLADPANVKIAAQDAIATIDGVDVTRGKNTIDDAIAGVTLTLASAHAAADPDSQLTVGLDTSALRDKVKAMVSSYNAVNGALHVQLDYSGTAKGTSTLFGDPTLRQLQGALASVLSAGYGGSSLAAIGVSRDKTGAMTLDEAKLADALTKDPDAVAGLFVTGGLAAAGSKLTTAYASPGDGLLTQKSRSIADRYTALGKQADQINARADALKTQLEQQFTQLEKAMTDLKNQSAQLTRLFG